MSRKKVEHFFGRALIEQFTQWGSLRRRSSSNRDQHSPHLVYWIKFLEAEGLGFKEATAQTFNRYQAWLLNYTSRFGRPLAIKSQLNTLCTLQVFYHFLYATGHLLHNPAQKMRLPKERKTLPTDILTAAEARRLLKQTDLNTVSGFRDRTMLELLYSCGLRISELRQLKKEDFDAFNRTLCVREGKGDKDRLVPVGETACRYLADYIAQVRPLLLKEQSDVLFLNRFGRMFGVSGICKKLKAYVKAAKIKKPSRYTASATRWPPPCYNAEPSCAIYKPSSGMNICTPLSVILTSSKPSCDAFRPSITHVKPSTCQRAPSAIAALTPKIPRTHNSSQLTSFTYDPHSSSG